MPTPTVEVIESADHSPFEIESLPELALHTSRGTVAGLTLQGLPLSAVDLTSIDVTRALFVGCALSPEQTLDLIRRGAEVVPAFSGLPYPTQPSHLYTSAELSSGFDGGGFAAMYDTRVYRHYVT